MKIARLFQKITKSFDVDLFRNVYVVVFQIEILEGACLTTQSQGTDQSYYVCNIVFLEVQRGEREVSLKSLLKLYDSYVFTVVVRQVELAYLWRER